VAWLDHSYATSSTGAVHTASVTLSVVASGSPDYTVELTPTTQYVSAGGSVTYGVRVVPVRGFTGNVVLTTKSVPGGVSLGWNGTTPTTAQNPSVTVAVGGANSGTATLRSPRRRPIRREPT
jgi:hypothetical protein